MEHAQKNQADPTGRAGRSLEHERQADEGRENVLQSSRATRSWSSHAPSSAAYTGAVYCSKMAFAAAVRD